MDSIDYMADVLSWILGFSCVYLLGTSLTAYRKARSWAGIRQRVFLLVLNLVGLFVALRARGMGIPDWLLAALCVATGLLALYFAGVCVGTLRRTRSWADVRSMANLTLFGLAVWFIFLLALAPDPPGMAIAVAWTGGVAIFGLIAFWNMLWVTFTKKDFPPLAPLAQGVTLALYVIMMILAWKELF